MKCRLLGVSGEFSVNHKLKDCEVVEIRRLVSLGLTQALVAKMFRISRSYVYHLKRYYSRASAGLTQTPGGGVVPGANDSSAISAREARRALADPCPAVSTGS